MRTENFPPAKRATFYTNAVRLHLENRQITIARLDDGVINLETKRYVGKNAEVRHTSSIIRGVFYNELFFSPEAWNAILNAYKLMVDRERERVPYDLEIKRKLAKSRREIARNYRVQQMAKF